MLLEDELGTLNLIVPPPIHERFRLAVRSEPLVLATGRLEQREGTTNVLVDHIERLERPDLPVAKVKHIEPRRVWSSEAGEAYPLDAARNHGQTPNPAQPAEPAASGLGGLSPRLPSSEEADLRAVAPAGHSFGRRGR